MEHPSATMEPMTAMSPPPGHVSNLHDHQNHLWKYNVVAQTVCMVIAGTLFCLRCYVRLGFSRMRRQWVLEDWMVCLSFIGLVAYSSLMSIMMNSNGGVHQWDLTPTQAHRVLYLFWLETIIYGPFIFFTKLSILLLYLRLLVPTRWSPLWTTIQIFIAISASFYTAITIVKIFQCSPRERAWDKTVQGSCIDLPVLLQVSGLFNTISDALILLVPVRAVGTLKMGWGKKVGVCAIFTIGAVAPVFSAIGFAARVQTSKSKDLTYNNPLLLLWATAELSTGVICACLPALPALLRGGRNQTSSPCNSENRRSTSLQTSDGSFGRGKEVGFSAYVELEDRPEFGTEVGEGGSKVGASKEGGDNANEETLAGMGIVRTVRVETLREN